MSDQRQSEECHILSICMAHGAGIEDGLNAHYNNNFKQDPQLSQAYEYGFEEGTRRKRLGHVSQFTTAKARER